MLQYNVLLKFLNNLNYFQYQNLNVNILLIRFVVDESQNNNVKVYTFNPFEPKTQIIQTKTGVIRITPKGK